MFQAVDFYAMRANVDWQPFSFFPMDFSANSLAFKPAN